MRDAITTDQPTLFYLWSPSEFLASNNYVRVLFPTETESCKNRDTFDRFGGRDCDQGAGDILKFSSATLSQRSLVASKFIEAFDIGLEDQELMLTNLSAARLLFSTHR